MLAAKVSMAVVEEFPLGFAVVDRDLRLYHSNLEAGRLINSSHALRIEQGALVACRPTQQMKLRQAVRKVLEDGEDGRPAAVVIEPRLATAQKYVLSIKKLPQRWVGNVESLARIGAGDRDLAIVTIDGTGSLPIAQELLQQTFRLTRSEAAIAKLLANGYSPKQIAEERGSSLATVRTQIRTLMEKTGCTRTSEVIVLYYRFSRF